MLRKMMELSGLEKRLFGAMGEFEIIDCHEHLPPEDIRLEAPADVFTLFSHYTGGDLMVAGMAEVDYRALRNQDIPLERRWALFAPYWEQIRWGSYARAALLAADKFYGVADINSDTYQTLSDSIQAANTPGIYTRVLRDACRISTALTECGIEGTYERVLRNGYKIDTGDEGEPPLLTPVMPTPWFREDITWETVAHPTIDPQATVRSLDDYLDVVRHHIEKVKSAGAAGLKMRSSRYGAPDREQAISAFERLRRGEDKCFPQGMESNPLLDYVIDQTISCAAEQDLVIAVHTGYWGDFRRLDPLHIIPMLQRHPNARFDIFHLGYPWVRETLMLGKGFPNVWLNFCWTHIISQRCAMDALDEAIDLIPSNKILAFGGDYSLPVEKVYGHLYMARENIARVLAGRIERKRMTETKALDLARKWFWHNPKDLYRLNL